MTKQIDWERVVMRLRAHAIYHKNCSDGHDDDMAVSKALNIFADDIEQCWEDEEDDHVA